MKVKHRFFFPNCTADRKIVQFRKRALNGQLTYQNVSCSSDWWMSDFLILEIPRKVRDQLFVRGPPHGVLFAFYLKTEAQPAAETSYPVKNWEDG
jgi:hypothetical protein